MRRSLLFLFGFIFLLACKKEGEPDAPASYSDKIVLNDIKVVGDSVKLQWSKLENSGFTNYTILRKTPLDNYQMTVGQSYQADKVSFTDNNVPYSSTVEYQVVVRLSPTQTISSNIVTYQRSDIKTLSITPYDAQFRSQNRMLYFFEKDGKIHRYDLKNQQLAKTINTSATIGYCDFAMNGGVEELYVPRNDGWVFIYDAATLEKIDQLNVGTDAVCVVANNGLLFVSASSSSSWSYQNLKVYNRATKQLITQTGSSSLGRLIRFPNTTTELLQVGSSSSQVYYSFNANGTSASSFSGYGNYPLDASNIEVFPRGDKYITSSSGAVYSKGMAYESSLPRGSKEFTTYSFDEAAQLIYAGTRTKSVEVYTMNGYNNTRSIPTKAYPYKLFKDPNGGFICVSAVVPGSYYSSSATGLVIEQIK